VLDQVAKRLGATPAQVALAWVLHRSPVMLPIPGTSRVKHLEENVAAAALELTDDDFRRLDEVGRQEWAQKAR
jgi:pyridoxine 4-dehydrogenase